MRRIFARWLSLILVLIAVNGASYAQSGATTGEILGSVKDSTDAALSGATVTVRQLSTNLTRMAQTDGNGNYQFIHLPPDRYELKATAENFQDQVEMITLTLGTTALIDFNLHVVGSTEIVEVTAGNDLQTATASSTNVERDRIDALPSRQRNFLDLSLISPRVTADRLPNVGSVATSGISINSQSARFNNITIDGLDNNDHVTGSVRSTFNQDGIQEFQVVSDSYSAEFGRVLGGVVNIVTRGGGNDIHGNIFFLNRNDRLAARDAFSRGKPGLDLYQFGAILSGPIKKDKLFYFTSVERNTSKQSNIVTIRDDDVMAARQLGFDLRNGPVPYALGTTTLLARLDAALKPNDTFWLRYNGGFTFNGNYQPFGGLVAESNGGAQKLNDNTIAVDNSYISVGLNLVNETRFLFGRRDQDIVPLAPGPLVLVNGEAGQIRFGRDFTLPQSREEKIYQIIDNVSLARKDQQIKFGVDFSYTNLGKLTLPTLASGAAIFTPIDFSMLAGTPGLPILNGDQALNPQSRTPEQRNFLMTLDAQLPTMFPGFPQNQHLEDLPLPIAYSQSFGNPVGNSNYKFFSLFFQDDIKLRANLLIKIGARYDRNYIKFAPTSGTLSPRFAISYQPAHLQKLNLRAAYGIFVGAPITGPILDADITTSSLQNFGTPFPFSILAFNQPGHHFPESASQPVTIVPFVTQLNQSITVDSKLRNSYTEQTTAGIDYFAAKNTTISLTYDFVRGVRLFGSRNINPVTMPIFGNPIQNAILGRPDATRGDVYQLESAFDSYYHALTIVFNRRLSDRLVFLAHYTYSKAIDDTVDFFPLFQEDAHPLNPNLERGLSIQDARNQIVASGNYNARLGKNILLRDYQLSTIISYTSGRPYNLLAGVDLDGSDDMPPADRPLGLGRNAGITPNLINVDLRFSRNFIVKERYRGQFFIEAFNLFNRVNFDPNDINRIFPPDRNGNFILPPKDGSRFSAPPDRENNSFPARQLQLGVRLSF